MEVEFEWNTISFESEMHEKAMDGLEELATVVMLTEMKNTTPVDHGTLRDNETVERRADTVVIGTGKVTDSYAEVVHNDRSIHHKVGKAGFVEDPFNAHKGEANEYIAKHTGMEI